MGILTGKTAVITGSSRGLGLAIATTFASEGANVVVSARNQEILGHSVIQLKELGYHAVGFACDTTDADQVEALAVFAEEHFGHIDIWVNNAGIGAPYGSTLLVPQTDFEKVIKTNILGVYYGSITALKHMLPNNSGKLINLVGRGAEGPVPFQNAYASSKIWVHSFTQSLAREYSKSGISINAFNPGLVLTDMTSQVEVCPGFEEKVKPLNTILRVLGNPPAVPARKALWLASSATDGKTGLYVNMLNPITITHGVMGELGRRISGKPSPIPEIQIRSTES